MIKIIIIYLVFLLNLNAVTIINNSSTKHNNTKLNIGNNLAINTNNNLNIKGANVTVANHTSANIKGDLNIVSLRDKATSKSSSMSIGISGAKGSGVTGSNGSVSISKNITKTVVTSSFISNSADISVAKNTHLEGSILATKNADGTANDNLNLSTNTLTSKNLSNITYAKGNSASAGKSRHTVNANLSNSLTYNKTKTLATLGNGIINITNKKDSQDLANINRDTSNTTKKIFNVDNSLKVNATIDTRLMTKDGRKKIKDDLKTSSKITDTIQKIATLKDVSITDFFSQTNKSVKQYQAYKEVLANNKELAKKLANKNLPLEEKQKYQNQFKTALEAKLGYKLANEIKTISTDEKGQGKKDIKGFISTQNDTIYSNDKNQHSTKDTLETMGQELAGGMPRHEGIDITKNRKQHNNYQDAIAKDTVDDISFIMNNYHDKSLATENTHNTITSNNSIFNLAKNNNEFKGLDKEKGDNLTIFTHGTNSSPKDADKEFIKSISKTYDEPVVQVEWSGDNSKKARTDGAKKIKELVENHNFKDGEKLNIVGHSHGGNVNNEFTSIYKGNKKIDNYTNLAKPVREDYPLDYTKFEKNANIKNVYDDSDMIQIIGGTDTAGNNKRFGLADRIINNEKVENIKIEVQNTPSIFNVMPGTILPSIIKDAIIDDHIEMDSKKVWEKINEK